MSETIYETDEQREIIFLSQNGWVEWVGSDEIEWEGPDVSAAEKDLLRDYEKLKCERDSLRDSLAKTIRQRDEAIEHDESRNSGTSVAATSTWGQAIASMAVSPMTGRQLQEKFCDFVGVASNWDTDQSIYKESWNALAAHIWPNARQQPDRREELLSQVKRTDHGDCVVILELGWKLAIAQDSKYRSFWSCPPAAGLQYANSKSEAIAAATEWLVDQAMKDEKID